ncbi:MAG: LysM peptidoglycan-binding domain-containing protein [Phycisphaerales bacterium]|nr:LysM peptidoglycan-binding domain-containing protein [Phycisphaerales bacterium]
MTRLTTLLIAIFVVAVTVSSLEAREYTVAPKDTLSKIASEQLGSARRWKEIADLNGIQSPYGIRVGQRLVLPDGGSETHRPEDIDFEAMQRDYDEGMANLRDQIQTGRSEPRIVPFGHLWAWFLAAMLLFWVFCALCLRWGAWFSLVDTTFMRCMYLSLIYAGLEILLLVILATIGSFMQDKEPSPIASMILMFLLVLLNFIFAAYFTKRILGCQWRSVVTVTVMASLVANLIAVGIIVIVGLVFGAANFDAIREHFGVLMMSHGH